MTLLDQRARPLRDLRISVTDRCNFRCTYCMPREHFGKEHAFLPREDLLTYEEITSLVEALIPLGLEKVRLTGGEPLLRNDLSRLVTMLRECGPGLDLALTTNGALLATNAEVLKAAGLNRVTVSLDALDPTVFASMADTKAHSPKDILAAIDVAREVGLGVKVNTVVRKGVNEHEILRLAEACTERKVPLRFIEYMDVGNTNAWMLDQVVSGREVQRLIEEAYGPLQPEEGQNKHDVARRFQTSTGHRFGFINSVTEPFCGDCSRARLSANGSIYTCLFSSKGHDIKTMMHMNATKTDLQQAVHAIWSNRNDRYSVERSAGKDVAKVEMSFIGG